MAVQSRVALLCAAFVSSSCFSPGDGIEPPLDRIYFPVGLALNVPETNGAPGTRRATHLFVANSNFDLQFNGGTLQSYDLGRLRSLVPQYCRSDADCAGRSCARRAEDPSAPPWCVDEVDEPCGPFGTRSAASQKNVPGYCGFVDPSNPQDGGDPVIDDKVEIGAFATDIIYREPDGAAPGEGRLLVPVRGDATLHWLDVTGGSMECGQQGNDNECDDYHRVGDDPDEENTRGLRMPTEPFGIAASTDGTKILVTHQTEGKVSLFTQEPTARAEHLAPRLEFVQDGLPSRAIGVAAVPRPRLAAGNENYEDAFLVTYRNAAQVDQLRVTPELDSASPPRPYLWQSGGVRIAVNSLGYDSRGIALDATERGACEAECGEGDTACFQRCAALPLGVYVANRTPETLIVGKTNSARNLTSSSDLPVFTDTMDLSVGPSRVLVGKIIDAEGKLATRIFVVCFDSRLIFGYDPVSGRIDTRIWTGRGPHSFVVDVDQASAEPGYALGYVGHFTDSYIGVIDLDQRHSTYGTIVLTLGRPQAPRAQK